MNAPMLPVPARIARVEREIEGVVTFELETERRVAFSPGQFNMLYLFGLGEVAISISGDPEGGRWVHTIRAVGSVTTPMVALAPGAPLGVRGPYGVGWPLEEARGKDVVFVAGGLGLAPLRPAILHVLAHRQDYARVSILFGARTPESILFRTQLQAWRARFDVDVEVTVDRAGREWGGKIGVVPELIRAATFDPESAIAMVCGPEMMMRFSVRALEGRGLPHHAIHLSLERNMKCAIGFCGHCMLGPSFLCKDGPVLRFDRVAPWFYLKEA